MSCAASQPACWPAHNCKALVASCMSVPMMVRIAFLIIWWIVSPIPMGLTPGHLTSAINLLAVNAVKPLGLTYMIWYRYINQVWPVHHIDLMERDDQGCPPMSINPRSIGTCYTICLQSYITDQTASQLVKYYWMWLFNGKFTFDNLPLYATIL